MDEYFKIAYSSANNPSMLLEVEQNFLTLRSAYLHLFNNIGKYPEPNIITYLDGEPVMGSSVTLDIDKYVITEATAVYTEEYFNELDEGRGVLEGTWLYVCTNLLPDDLYESEAICEVIEAYYNSLWSDKLLDKPDWLK